MLDLLHERNARDVGFSPDVIHAIMNNAVEALQFEAYRQAIIMVESALQEAATGDIRQEAGIIQAQSAKIKDLVQDLIFVSQLEYEMQPIHKEPVRLSKLLRSYAADLLKAGIGPGYSVKIGISSSTETAVMACDPRLISRAINDLVQNSIRHNPQGCTIRLCLHCSDTSVSLTISDDGVGLPAEKLRELEENPHYMESTDERLDLRHGLGLLLVRQIAETHGGTMKIVNGPYGGVETTLTFT